jgi:signal transduction histidine kinase
MPHIRHTVATWFRDLPLAGRLSAFVAMIVIAVVASVAYLEVRSFETHIGNDLADAGRLGAESAARMVDGRSFPLDPLDIRDGFHDLLESDPVLDAISMFEADASRAIHLVTSTSTEERAEAVELATRAVATEAAATDRTGTVVMFAVPVSHHPSYAVVVSVGLESLIQARSHGLRVALGFAVPTIILVTGLVYLIVRRIVGAPLHAILQTIDRTAKGSVGERAPITRRDEFGVIALGLNRMLDELARFNQSLSDRVFEATRALSLRNTQLAASRNELLAARESLAQAERVAAVGQLAANVAHQAGTPLNLISGYVQMIREHPRTDAWTRARLQTVDAQIQQVTRVLSAMLDHARSPAGLETVSIVEIVTRVRELSLPRLSRSRIHLDVAIADDVPPLTAEATQLEMALLHLVTNAIDAMPQGGTLSIDVRPHARSVRIEVADTGSGIPADILDRMFDPWVTTKPRGHGTGLGLAIVRDVIRAHGGTVAAANRPDGATFVIDLPLPSDVSCSPGIPA